MLQFLLIYLKLCFWTMLGLHRVGRLLVLVHLIFLQVYKLTRKLVLVSLYSWSMRINSANDIWRIVPLIETACSIYINSKVWNESEHKLALSCTSVRPCIFSRGLSHSSVCVRFTLGYEMQTKADAVHETVKTDNCVWGDGF